VKFRRDWTARALAVVALAVAIGGGTAFAAGRYLITSTKQIKPSVLKALRKPGPAGPAGAQGPQGPKGATGSAGANGAVAAYFANTGSTPVSLTDAQSKTVVSKALPAGTWLISADISVDAQQMNSSAGVAVGCTLQGGGINQSKGYVSPWDSNDDNTAQGTISWDVAVNITSGTTMTMSCTDYSGTNGNIDSNSASITANAAISAVQVNSLS
jgi:hypothetical protein